MFGYLRVFILVSLISVVLIAAMVGFYLRSVTKNDLITLAETQNNLLINSYIEAVWRKTPYPAHDFRSSNYEAKKAVFQKESKQYFDIVVE